MHVPSQHERYDDTDDTTVSISTARSTSQHHAKPNGSPPHTLRVVPIVLILISFYVFGRLFDNVNEGFKILNVSENTNTRFDIIFYGDSDTHTQNKDQIIYLLYFCYLIE